MLDHAYRQLAARLDELPNGFPPTEEGIELQLLARLFTPAEAALTAQLRLTPETAEAVAARVGGDPDELRRLLKGLARRGLIAAQRTQEGLSYGLMPFVIGFYERQVDAMDAQLAGLFEAYYQRAFHRALTMQPPLHRVVPIGESIRTEIEVRPFESAAGIVEQAQAWGVLDCICRKQKALIGDPCAHPINVCMALSPVPGAFDSATLVRALTRQEALDVLRQAAQAGLVHSVSNSRDGTWYICNCCTCSCGILRGMAELGIADVVARSPFLNQVDDEACIGCGECLSRCSFGALSLADTATVDPVRCVGCGVCTLACTQEAMHLVRRSPDEIQPPPVDETAWRQARAAARGLDLDRVL